MYNDTMKEFLEGIEDRVKKIEEYKKSSNMTNYAILVHALKSDSKYLGFTALADISYKHELKSKESDINYINDNFDELMNELKRIIELIKKYLKIDCLSNSVCRHK